MLVRLVLLDVVVAVLGQEVAGAVDIEALLLHDLDELHVAVRDGVTEHVHLGTMVVDVELALDVIAGMAHDAAEGVAKRSPTAVADVHRTDGVGGNELDLGLQALADVGLGKVHALLAVHVQHRVVGGGVEVEVDEAGAGHLDLGDGSVLGHVRHDGIGDLARGAMGELQTSSPWWTSTCHEVSAVARGRSPPGRMRDWLACSRAAESAARTSSSIFSGIQNSSTRLPQMSVSQGNTIDALVLYHTDAPLAEEWPTYMDF